MADKVTVGECDGVPTVTIDKGDGILHLVYLGKLHTVMKQAPDQLPSLRTATEAEVAMATVLYDTFLMQKRRDAQARCQNMVAHYPSLDWEALERGELEPAHLVMASYRAPGQGGWSFRPEQGVRIVHTPTGLSAQCDDDRSQHKNKVTALSQLKALVIELAKERKKWT